VEYILGYALGDIRHELHVNLTEILPTNHLPGWSVRTAATSTDGLMAIADHEEICPWTTLLVTPWITGDVSLSTALVALKQKWSHLRIAVLIGAMTPEYRPLITTLASWQIFNVLVAEEFTYPDLVALITQDATWDAVQPYLSRPEGLMAPPQATLPAQVVNQRKEMQAPRMSRAIAVVSAQGRVGKSGFVANALWVSSGECVAIDLNLEHPALPLYFRDAHDPFPVHLQELMTSLSALSRRISTTQDDQLMPQDKQVIADYVDRAVTVTARAKLVPGPLRNHAMAGGLPYGAATEMIRQAKRMADTVWVDTPSSPAHPLWEEIIRASDLVVVLTPPDALGVLETLALFDRLALCGVPRSHIRLVVSRVGAGGLPPHEIATVHLQPPLSGMIADQPKAWDAAFRAHVPLADRQKKTWVALLRQIEKGAVEVVAAPEKPSKKASKWSIQIKPSSVTTTKKG